MTDEFNLSKKIINMRMWGGVTANIISPEDVKEFIRLLKKETEYWIWNEEKIKGWSNRIDKLAGDKLI